MRSLNLTNSALLLQPDSSRAPQAQASSNPLPALVSARIACPNPQATCIRQTALLTLLGRRPGRNGGAVSVLGAWGFGGCSGLGGREEVGAEAAAPPSARRPGVMP